MQDSVFRACNLVRKNRTEEAEMLRTSEMVTIEDMNPDALPGPASGLS